MMAAVVDTNVLVVANNDRSPQAPYECVIACVEQLQAIQRDGMLVVDDRERIIEEYKNNVTAGVQKPGDQFLLWVHRTWTDRCERVPLTQASDDPNDFAEFPDDPDLARFDRSDRKFVAVARASAHHPPILNATDTDWRRHRGPLKGHGVAVVFLCPDMMTARG